MNEILNRNLSKQEITRLATQRKFLTKSLTNYNAKIKSHFNDYFSVIKEEKQFMKLESSFSNFQREVAEELMLTMTAQCFQELEEFYSYMSSQEKPIIDCQQHSFYNKLLIVFNIC